MYYGSYTCITELILVFRILYLYYEDTCMTDLILVLRSLFLYFGSYTCITEHILVSRILYLCYRAYSCISDLILVLRDLFLCEGTRRFILVHISRRTHICNYIIFIYLYRNTYTRTCPYHRHIHIKSPVGVLQHLCVRRYP